MVLPLLHILLGAECLLKKFENKTIVHKHTTREAICLRVYSIVRTASQAELPRRITAPRARACARMCVLPTAYGDRKGQ